VFLGEVHGRCTWKYRHAGWRMDYLEVYDRYICKSLIAGFADFQKLYDGFWTEICKTAGFRVAFYLERRLRK
jgi:hypothetical protein